MYKLFNQLNEYGESIKRIKAMEDKKGFFRMSQANDVEFIGIILKNMITVVAWCSAAILICCSFCIILWIGTKTQINIMEMRQQIEYDAQIFIPYIEEK